MKTIYDDIFHNTMRLKMKENYYLKGGRERSIIRKYIKRYSHAGLTENYLLGCANDAEKIVRLKLFAAEHKFQHKFQAI